jgi:hypothetical protein
VALSLRVYEGQTGEVVGTLFHAESGLDRESLLGIGAVDGVEELIDRAAADVVESLVAGGRRRPQERGHLGDFGRIALVPITTTLPVNGVEVSLEVSEALRAILETQGVALAQPACVRQALRGPEGDTWGELSAGARERVRARCAAETIVTGAVERWELTGGSRGPIPVVAVALRLLDAESGRILRTASLEESGADRPGWFGAGRVHSKGELLHRLLGRLATQLLDEREAARRRSSS